MDWKLICGEGIQHSTWYTPDMKKFNKIFSISKYYNDISVLLSYNIMLTINNIVTQNTIKWTLTKY